MTLPGCVTVALAGLEPPSPPTPPHFFRRRKHPEAQVACNLSQPPTPTLLLAAS